MTDLLGTIRGTATLIASRLRIDGERGATAVEYGLMITFIAAAIIASVVFLGSTTSDAIDCTASSVQARNSVC